MDYIRIYRAFIEDRRAKPAPDGYIERHHILPRSLGGGDEPDNLIRLSAEDHFFAHLLLAKMHGGKMISALWRMLQSSEKNWGRKTTARRGYGIAQRMVAEHLRSKWTGDGNPLFNATEYHWWNYRTKQEKRATLFAMHAEHGASRATWTAVANGDRPSIKGWMLVSRREQHTHSEKGQSFSFVNRDGRTFTGTQSAFCTAFGVNPASASRVVRGKSVTICGWRLQGVEDRVANAPKDGRRGAALGTGRKYHLRHRDGRTFSGCAEDFRIMAGKPVGFCASVRLGQLVRGAMPSLYGWSLEKVEARDARRAKL